MEKKTVKYARLAEEAKRLFGSVNKLAKDAGVAHSNLFTLISGKYPANEEGIRKKIEKAILEKDPEIKTDRLWDMTEAWCAAHPIQNVIEFDGRKFKIIAICEEILRRY